MASHIWNIEMHRWQYILLKHDYGGKIQKFGNFDTAESVLLCNHTDLGCFLALLLDQLSDFGHFFQNAEASLPSSVKRA